MEKTSFRLAANSDTKEILKIYAPYILETPLTFECTVPTVSDFSKRIENIQKNYPFIVCENKDKLLGYIYACLPIKSQEAYSWNVEISVYVDKNSLGSGLGKRLYSAMLKILRLQNIQNVYGGITLPNGKSVGLHETLGFEKIAIYYKNGFKLGKWHDVVWYGKVIGKHEANPPKFISIDKIDTDLVQKILCTA